MRCKLGVVVFHLVFVKGVAKAPIIELGGGDDINNNLVLIKQC